MKIIFDQFVWKWVFHLCFVSNIFQLMLSIVQGFDLLWDLEFLLFCLNELEIQFLMFLSLKKKNKNLNLKLIEKRKEKKKKLTICPRDFSWHHFPKNNSKRKDISFHFVVNWNFCILAYYSSKYFWCCIPRWKSFNINQFLILNLQIIFFKKRLELSKEKRKRKRKKRSENTFESWILAKPKSQITEFNFPSLFSNNTFDLQLFNYCFEKIKLFEKKKNNYDLRSLWTIPNSWVIFIPDAISLDIFIIISLGITSVRLLINADKSVSYNYIGFCLKFIIELKERKWRKLLL